MSRSNRPRRTGRSWWRRKQYQLTETGADLFVVILALRQWAERHAFTDGGEHSVLVDQAGSAVPDLTPVSNDGQPLTAATTAVRHVR
ncbi:MAG: hypothetical protein L0G99_11135 [Propionibacteriales bacterium]|nr:hypothetical protein [Propionibacteriales bacterium]